MEREKSLDVLKALCAFFVVCIHSSMSGVIAEYYIAITRVAVPTFFVISGYFYSDDSGKSNKQIKKIAWIIIWSNALFFIWKLFWNGIHSVSFRDSVSEMFTIQSLRNLILFNESPINGHLWYLNALLYVLAIMSLLHRLSWNTKKMYFMIPFLLAADLIFGKYSPLFFGDLAIPFIYTRNFLFVGLPYFLIGNLMRDHKNIFLPNRRMIFLVLVVVFSVCNIIERYELLSYNIYGIREHYISTTLLAVSMFCLFKTLIIPDNNKRLDLLVDIGRRDSAYIYIIHPIIINVIVELAQKYEIWDWFMYLMPITVYILSVVLVRLIRYFVLMADFDYNVRG